MHELPACASIATVRLKLLRGLWPNIIYRDSSYLLFNRQVLIGPLIAEWLNVIDLKFSDSKSFNTIAPISTQQKATNT